MRGRGRLAPPGSACCKLASVRESGLHSGAEQEDADDEVVGTMEEEAVLTQEFVKAQRLDVTTPQLVEDIVEESQVAPQESFWEQTKRPNGLAPQTQVKGSVISSIPETVEIPVMVVVKQTGEPAILAMPAPQIAEDVVEVTQTTMPLDGRRRKATCKEKNKSETIDNEELDDHGGLELNALVRRPEHPLLAVVWQCGDIACTESDLSGSRPE